MTGMRRVGSTAGFCLAALFGTLAAQVVWTGLLVTNLKASPAIPWAVIVMAAVLWGLWRYFGGAWWPASTQQARRRYRRANRLPKSVLLLALIAGLVALGGLIALWLVLTQLVRVPGNPAANFAGYPPLTIVTVLVMASLVGAVTEEVGVRGYMLTRLEGELGAWLAVVIAAVVISPGHGMTQGFILPTLLWYFVADLMFGALSLLTRSILPGIAVHAVGLLAFFAVIWPTDRYRNVASLRGEPVAFWIELVIGLVLFAVSLYLFVKLASITRARRIESPAT